MADPLTAFATAGSVLQLVDFGSRLLGLIIKYAKDGGVTEVESIESYVHTLMAANQQLQTKLENADNLVQPGSARALSIANKQCLTMSEELVMLLQSLKLTKLTWWSVAKTALRAHKAQPKLQELRSRLESCKTNLSICFMVYAMQQNQFSGNNAQRDASKIEVLQMNMHDIQKKWLAQPGLAEDIRTVIQKMQDTSIHYDLSPDLMDVANQHVFAVKGLSKELGNSFRTRNSDIKNLDQDMKELESKIDHETRTRSLILLSLSFPEMSERVFGVKRAHNQTYSWIFDVSDNTNYCGDNFMEWLRDREGNSLYWIRGKAGSGKSTLVREIFEDLLKPQENRSWRTSRPIFTAVFFFWYAGTILQRSFQGILRTFIHQILQAHPDFIYGSVGNQKWQQAWHIKHEPLSWSVDELKTTLLYIVREFEKTAALLLLIDGLDEFQGNDEERIQMIEFLAQLTESPWVKICVSSRPWNVYKDAFDGCPQIRLESLTRADIRKFVQDSFTADKLFMRKTARDPDLLQNLTTQIADNAEGVFLWVRLVIRDLLKSIRDGSSPRHLFRVLANMPKDLDAYFGHMMNQMDVSYMIEAALLFKLKLSELSYKPFDREESIPGPSLRVMDLIHLNWENPSEYFMLDDDYEVNDLTACELEVLKEQFDSLERRIASRSMGLLEVAQHLWDRRGLITSKVVFLHRTVKDFLCTSNAQDRLDRSYPTTFDALAFRCNSMVDRLITLGPRRHRQSFDSDATIISCISCFIQCIQRTQIDHVKMIKIYQKAAPTISLFINLKAFGSQLSPFERWVGDKIEIYEDLYLTIAIQQGWKALIDHICAQRGQSERTIDYLLDLSLRPFAGTTYPPSQEMVAHIISLGANPNAKLSKLVTNLDESGTPDENMKAPHFQRGSPRLGATIWTQWLLECHDDDAALSSELKQSLLTIMIEAGSKHYLPNELFVRHNVKTISSPACSEFDRPEASVRDNLICSTNCPDHQRGNEVSLLQHLETEPSEFRNEIWQICKKIDLRRVRS